MKNEVLKAWNVAVCGFRYGEPEHYKSFSAFWEDNFNQKSNESATETEMRAFEILYLHGLKLPAYVADGK